MNTPTETFDTADALRLLQKHCADNAELINQYLQVAKTQFDFTARLMRVAADEHLCGPLTLQEGAVVKISAQGSSPADILKKMQAIPKEKVSLVLFDPNSLTVYVQLHP